MSLLGLPSFAAAVSAVTYKYTWVDSANVSKSVPSVVQSCTGPIAVSLAKLTDSSSLERVAKYLVCVRLAFLRALSQDRAGLGAILIYASVLLPFALRLSYNAASPNRTSRFQGPLLPIVAFALSSLDALLVGSGVGVALPPLLALSHVIGSFTSTHGQHISLPKLPCATTAVYGSNLATILVAIFVLITCAHDGSIATHEYWWEPYASPQIRSLAKPALGVLSDVSPLVIIAPILAWGFKNVEHPTNTQESNRILHEYLAEDIAYGFERTWAYYRQTGLLSTMAYWFGLSMFYRSIFQDHTTPSQSAQYLVLVSLSVAVSHIATVVADILAYQADDLDSEATAAIKRAPAGNPGIDDNPISLILLGLIAGPSLPLMLWLARGEEIRGWKGRRAWRVTVASKS